jgi:peptidoglycan/LPS O-acetylase OafA/YrhL
VTTPRPTGSLVVALQGAAAVLFCVAQFALLFQPSELDWIRPMDGLLRSGNVALSALLTCLGFTMTRRLFEARRAGFLGPLWVVGRYLVVVFGVLVAVDLAVLLIHRFDSTDATTWEHSRSSVLNVLSLQWNTWVASHPLIARMDLSSLWFFSVATQLVLVLAVLVMMAGRRPRLLLGVAVLVVVAVVVTRPGQVESEGWYAVALSTVGWSDAFCMGVAAALLRRPALSGSEAGAVVGGVGLLLVGALIGASFVTVVNVFVFVVPVVAALTALFAFAADRDPDARSLLVQLMSTPETGLLGSLWPYVVGWSPFVAITLSRHASGSAPPLFILGLGCVAVAVLALANQRAVSLLVAWVADRWGQWRKHRQAERPAQVSL